MFFGTPQPVIRDADKFDPSKKKASAAAKAGAKAKAKPKVKASASSTGAGADSQQIEAVHGATPSTPNQSDQKRTGVAMSTPKKRARTSAAPFLEQIEVVSG